MAAKKKNVFHVKNVVKAKQKRKSQLDQAASYPCKSKVKK